MEGGWLCSARRGHQGETEHRKRRGGWDCETVGQHGSSLLLVSSVRLPFLLQELCELHGLISRFALRDAHKGFNGLNSVSG